MTNEERLDVLKRRFYEAILGDSTLTLLILSAFDSEVPAASDLPEFTAEPWMQIVEGAQVFGLCITRSLTRKLGEVEGLSIGFGIFTHVKVLEASFTEAESTLLYAKQRDNLYFNGTDELMGLEVTAKVRRQAAYHFFTQWQEFSRNARTLGAEHDPIFGTYTTEPRDYHFHQ